MTLKLQHTNIEIYLLPNVLKTADTFSSVSKLKAV